MITLLQIQEIREYLCGPRIYSEGVDLYRQYGANKMLLKRFQFDETAATREILIDELRKLAMLTEGQFAALPRKAKKSVPAPAVPKERDEEDALMELADSFGVTVDELVSPEFQERVLAMDDNEERIEELTEELENAQEKYKRAPEPVRKMIRFREKYKFLNEPGCPDVLKVLVSDMFAAYDRYKEAHAMLQDTGSDNSAALKLCGEVVENYLENREIWEELEYYRENGVVLGKAAKVRQQDEVENLADLPDIDLMKKIQSAKANVSKNKARRDADPGDTKGAELYDKWVTRLRLLEDERDRRKKK